jgi:hypothetical protein
MKSDLETVRHWHAQALYQQRRKHLWKLRCYVSWAAIAAILLTAGAFWLSSCTGRNAQPVFVTHPAAGSAPASAEEMPPHTLATLIMYNAGHEFDEKKACWCSAQCISKGDRYGLCVGCGHCFVGNVGNKFYVFRPDGKRCVATLLAKECYGQGDLSLFRIAAEDVLDTAPLWDGKTQPASLDIIGYPGGVGPKRLKVGKAAVYQDGTWGLPVLDGTIQPGNSGSGIFADGKLCGIVSGWGETHAQARTNCGYVHLCSLLKKHRNKLRGCRDGKCYLPESDGDEQVSDNGSGPMGSPNWKPQPGGKLPVYDGHGKRPPDLDSDKDMAHEIDVLKKKELVELKKEIAEINATIDILRVQAGQHGLDGAPGPRGPKGDPGPAGPPGSGGAGIDQATLNDLQIADQRNAGDVAALKTELALLKVRLDDLQKKQTAGEIKAQNQDVDILRIRDRMELVEKKLAGSVRITVRKDPAGNVSLEKGK